MVTLHRKSGADGAPQSFERYMYSPSLVRNNSLTDASEPRQCIEQLLHRNVQRFRGGLVFKAHRLCVSLNSRLNEEERNEAAIEPHCHSGICLNQHHVLCFLSFYLWHARALVAIVGMKPVPNIA